MSKKSSKDVTVNVTVNTLEFFQWYTGLNAREEIENYLFDNDTVSAQDNISESISREEIVKLLDCKQMTINSYHETVQDTELTINGEYIIVVADSCPFVPALNY